MNKKVTKRKIYVFADFHGMPVPELMGILQSELLRGKEIFSFEYNPDWLKSKYVTVLDPELQLYKGIQYLNDTDKANFGMFLDSSPDRWGRLLMRRREAALARIEKREERNLFETDYLMGVFDEHRLGGLRFKESMEGAFESDDSKLATPPRTSIRELEEISLRLEEENISNDEEYLKWLNMLMAPGSSLGGARPKASVSGTDQSLWIAKFPARNDTTDVGGWEAVTYELAVKAGIKMARSEARKYTSSHHTFLTKRFDRTHTGERIHFASAMTMLGYADGQDHMDGVSYLELAEFIIKNGASVSTDLEELWRRIVFSICVSNTDDHLRNHGFIFSLKGWILSPAFDINPVETGNGLKLNISLNDNAMDIDLALSVIDYFRISKSKALKIIEQVKMSVCSWRQVADKFNLSRSEQDLKSRAFSRAER